MCGTKCQISSGFCVPKIIKVSSFLTELLKNNGELFGSPFIMAVQELADFMLVVLQLILSIYTVVSYFCLCHLTLLTVIVFGLSIHHVCPSVRSFIQTDNCYHDISWTPWAILIKLTGNIHWPLVVTWLDSGGQRSRSQQAVNLSRWQMHPRRCWGVEVHVLA